MTKTGIHIKPCNTGNAEQHNERTKEYLERLDASGKKTYDIFRDETHLNKSWVNPDYQGRTLDQVLLDLKKEVKEKTGRAMQQKATPIREGVCPILPTTLPSDFRPVVDWYAAHGATVIRIDLHHDEGHTDAVTGERKHNHHAHIIVDYIDHSSGLSVKLTKEDISELQGVVANALHMERGTSKAETGAKHLPAQEYREMKAGENAARLETKCQELEQQLKAGEQNYEAQLLEMCKDYQLIGYNTVKNFDYLQAFNIEQLKPSPTEKNNRDKLDKECKRDLQHFRVKELLQEQSILRVLIANTQAAIRRIGLLLQKLAVSVNMSKIPQIAHEAQMRASIASAISERDQARAEARNAVESAKNAQIEAENLERQHNEDIKTIEKGEKQKLLLQQKLKRIAITLTNWPSQIVKEFENQGLREMVGTNRWDDAKSKSKTLKPKL